MNYASRLCIAVIFSCLFFGCNRHPYASTNRDYKKEVRKLTKELGHNPAEQTMSTADFWVGTTNFNLRKPNIVVIHHTAQNSCEQTLRTFTLVRTQVSAHYVICRDGIIHHMLNDYLRAWHGGSGRWGNINDVNSGSIGIELDNNGKDPFSDTIINSLLLLLDTLKKKYNIPAANFIGHADMAPLRKNDPNVHFPWKVLSEKGFGIWWPDTTGIVVPQGFQHWDALRIIGYDVRDTIAVTKAFKRKFLQTEGDSIMNDADRKILFTLYRKYME
jgi:N-acetylmuramoyl-L-alanine amidase